jgi:PAS domain S-box-containing protein
MEKRSTSADRGDGPTHPNLDFLHKQVATQTIDLEGLFTRDVSASGSFNFREIRNVTFGKLLEAMPLPTFLIDHSHFIVFANEAVFKIGPHAGSVVGEPFSKLFPIPTICEKALSALTCIFADRKNQVLESVLRINGRTLWGRITLRSIRFKDFRSVLAIVEDLTAEKKQLIINEKYHQLVQLFPAAIAEFSLPRPLSTAKDADVLLEAIAGARLVGGNAQFANMLGYPFMEALTGSKLNSLFPFLGEYCQFYRAWISEGFPIRTFEIKEEAQGTRRYFDNTLVGNVKNGSLFGFWTMHQDITLRKQSEQALKNARDKLEERVKERTAELQLSNERLIEEIGERQRAEQELAKLVVELKEALVKVKTLTGLLPICSSCKKIRDDRGYWTQVDVYVRDHSDADFTHSICPDCASKLYPDFYNP